MNKEIKERWLAALRSGDYVQGQGILHETDENGFETFCCLGVLCELAAQEGIVTRDVVDRQGGGNFAQYVGERGPRFGDTYTLPREVAEWADLICDSIPAPVRNSYNPGIEYEGEDTYLSELNDSRELNFKDIADVIEEQF